MPKFTEWTGAKIRVYLPNNQCPSFADEVEEYNRKHDLIENLQKRLYAEVNLAVHKLREKFNKDGISIDFGVDGFNVEFDEVVIRDD